LDLITSLLAGLVALSLHELCNATVLLVLALQVLHLLLESSQFSFLDLLALLAEASLLCSLLVFLCNTLESSLGALVGSEGAFCSLCSEHSYLHVTLLYRQGGCRCVAGAEALVSVRYTSALDCATGSRSCLLRRFNEMTQHLVTMVVRYHSSE